MDPSQNSTQKTDINKDVNNNVNNNNNINNNVNNNSSSLKIDKINQEISGIPNPHSIKLPNTSLLLENHSFALTQWPRQGKCILAQYGCSQFEKKGKSPKQPEEYVVVYQAYNSQIGKWAAKNGQFVGAPGFSTTRMTWIKTNFLWMQYRSDWGTKDVNQSTTLAIFLKRDAFLNYLKMAVPGKYYKSFGTPEEHKKALNSSKNFPIIRLQWDPDHSPVGGKCERRAIQLGLRNITGFIDGSDILKIEDISEFVEQMRQESKTFRENDSRLLVPIERVFPVEDKFIQNRIALFESEELDEEEKQKQLEHQREKQEQKKDRARKHTKDSQKNSEPDDEAQSKE